jgi:hypothetical protein
MNEHEQTRRAEEVRDKQHVVLLVCFDGLKAAARARRPLGTQLRSNGDVILDTLVLQVNAKYKASVYDPRRVLAGTLTAMLTWGLFGLVTGGVQSLVISAVLGAVCGGLYAYLAEHVLTKAELTRIGTRLPAQSSVLLLFAETSDPRSLLAATASHAPSVVSVATIGDDLTTRVLAGPWDRPLPLDQKALLSMIMLRYPDPKTAKQVASQMAADGTQAVNPPEVELVIETDRRGRRHVADPSHGVAAWAKSDVMSWGGFGLVFGALVGATGGGGILGFLKGGLLTGVAWGLFGLVAGALYGLWAGRAISARRLKGIGPLLAPGTSTLLAWAEGPVSQDTIDTLTAPGSQRLVLRFNPIEGGAVLDST